MVVSRLRQVGGTAVPSGAEMKYLLFAGENYYPSGGASDFIAAFDSVDAAKAHAEQEHRHDWAHIASFDGQTLKEVAEWQVLSRYSGGAWRDV